MADGQTSFQERLARLEKKNPAPVPQMHKGASGSGGGQVPRPPRRSGGGGGGRVPLIAFALLALFVIPAAAFFGTMYFQNNQEAIADIRDGARLMITAYGPADAEQRQARREMDGIMLRLNTGTMSQEEGAYWSSLEGQRELADKASKSINMDKLKTIAREKYGAGQ